VSVTPLSRILPAAVGLAVAGAVVGITAWMLPVNLRSVSPALLKTAGAGTPTVASLGRELVDLERIGPASQLLAATKTVNDPRAPALERAIEAFALRQPALIAWGGWDAALDPLFNLRSGPARGASTPALTFLIPAAAQENRRLLDSACCQPLGRLPPGRCRDSQSWPSIRALSRYRLTPRRPPHSDSKSTPSRANRLSFRKRC